MSASSPNQAEIQKQKGIEFDLNTQLAIALKINLELNSQVASLEQNNVEQASLISMIMSKPPIIYIEEHIRDVHDHVAWANEVQCREYAEMLYYETLQAQPPRCLAPSLEDEYDEAVMLLINSEWVANEHRYENELWYYLATKVEGKDPMRELLHEQYHTIDAEGHTRARVVNAEYEEMFEAWYDQPFDQPPPSPTSSVFARLGEFLKKLTHVPTVKGDVVTLGMWHNHWQNRPYGTGPLTNESAIIPSLVHPSSRWRCSGPLAGNIWYLDDIPTQHPEMGGASDSRDYGYGPEETRPPKKLEVAHFMDARALPYVDFELYITLKSYTMETGTVAATQAKLHRLAKSYLGTYITNHLPPELLLEVRHWTVLAAMIPSNSEMLGMEMMAQNKIYHQMSKAAQFKRDGKLKERLSWWQFRKPRMLEMYKPVPT